MGFEAAVAAAAWAAWEASEASAAAVEKVEEVEEVVEMVEMVESEELEELEELEVAVEYLDSLEVAVEDLEVSVPVAAMGVLEVAVEDLEMAVEDPYQSRTMVGGGCVAAVASLLFQAFFAIARGVRGGVRGVSCAASNPLRERRGLDWRGRADMWAAVAMSIGGARRATWELRIRNYGNGGRCSPRAERMGAAKACGLIKREMIAPTLRRHVRRSKVVSDTYYRRERPIARSPRPHGKAGDARSE